jgi:DNA-binding NarL/FixJ family response regulator
MAAGRGSREVAADLAMSTRTVERHITDLHGRLGPRKRTEAMVYALRAGLEPAGD